MAKTLSQTGIDTAQTVEAWHVTQSIDAFTGVEAYNITLSGSFNMTGSINGQPGLINPLTASYVISSSYAGTSTSASNALTASYALNIFNSDGTITSNRTASLDSNALLFDGTNSNLRYTPNSAGGYLQLEGKLTGVPRFGISVPASSSYPSAGFQLGMRAWDDPSFPGYGKIGDAFFYAGNATNGLNFMNPVGTETEDYIRFYAGNNALAVSDIHIHGTGSNRGYVGIGTENPNSTLDVNGNTTITGSLQVTSGITGSVSGTASFATTASYVLNAISSSFATLSQTASYATTALSASYAPGGSINTGRVLYVATTGNNATGTIGDISKPYLTLEGAVAAASSGDLIYVFGGSYTVTTTDAAGIAKDGITYYFQPGTNVTKSSSGDLFNLAGFTTGFNVYGSANFTKNTNSGYILYAGSEGAGVQLNVRFECNDITQTVGNTFSVSDNGNGNYTTIIVNNVTNSSGYIFNLSRFGNIDVTGNYFKTTASPFLTIGNGNYVFNIKANRVDSTAGITFNNLYNSTLDCNINITTGVGYAYVLTYGVILTLNGYTNAINNQGGILNHNGICVVLTNNSGVVKNTSTYSATVTGGEVNLKPIDNYPGSLNQSGGIVYVNSAVLSGYSLAMSITGGRTYMNGIFTNGYTYGNISINGANAEVIFNGKLVHGGIEYGAGKAPFNLYNGTLRLTGNIENILTNTFDGTCVNWSGGNLICDGVTLLTSNTQVPPIISLSTSQNLRVYSAGLTTNRIQNGGTLSAKKQKYKFTVSSVASTSITLNDGTGGNETFTESNTGVYTTVALLAQQMVALINASGTLDLTASQDTPGTDSYFYVEADVAGSPYTIPTTTNLSALGIRSNSYAITEVVGGTIIENANVI